MPSFSRALTRYGDLISDLSLVSTVGSYLSQGSGASFDYASKSIRTVAERTLRSQCWTSTITSTTSILASSCLHSMVQTRGIARLKPTTRCVLLALAVPTFAMTVYLGTTEVVSSAATAYALYRESAARVQQLNSYSMNEWIDSSSNATYCLSLACSGVMKLITAAKLGAVVEKIYANTPVGKKNRN